MILAASSVAIVIGAEAASVVCPVMAVVVAVMRTWIYWRIIWMIWVVRRMVWVIAAPAPVRVPCIAPVIRAIAPIRPVCRIPERIPERVPSIICVRPVAEAESYSEIDCDVRLRRGLLYYIDGVDCALDSVNRSIALINCSYFGIVFTPFGVNCAGVEIAVI